MKLKDTFITYEHDGSHITVPTGNSSFSGLLRSNETAAFIIESLKTETTEENIVRAMYEEYDAPLELIQSDVRRIIDRLRKLDAIE